MFRNDTYFQAIIGYYHSKQWGLNKMVTILQTTFSNESSRANTLYLLFKIQILLNAIRCNDYLERCSRQLWCELMLTKIYDTRCHRHATICQMLYPGNFLNFEVFILGEYCLSLVIISTTRKVSRNNNDYKYIVSIRKTIQHTWCL